MSSICVVGTGYVGLVAIASFAELGHRVVGLDVDKQKIDVLQQGRIPFYEPQVEGMLSKARDKGLVRFTTDYPDAVPDQDFVFICVNTPPNKRGRPRMDQITSAARGLASNLTDGSVVVNKSTGPVGMVDLITGILTEYHERTRRNPVVANPEFLRQGWAVHDFLHPHQIIIGARDMVAAGAVATLYEPLGAPVAVVEPREAEMAKLVSNAFRAMKISFINEIASISERVETDVLQIARLVAADKAIGPAFLAPGIGWGGNCLPKDITTLEHVAKNKGVRPRMLQAAGRVNMAQRYSVISKAESLVGSLTGRRVGVLGLAFKGGTDDVRQSPAIAVVLELLKRGAGVAVHDPLATENARRLLGDQVLYCDDPYQVAVEADVLFVLTDWPVYTDLDLRALAGPMRAANLVDGRNLFDPGKVTDAGFRYVGVGRGNSQGAVDETHGTGGEMECLLQVGT